MRPDTLGVKVPLRTATIPFQFRAEPVAIREARDLGHAAKALFTAILDDARKRSWRTRITNAALADRIGASVPTVKRALARLEAAGLIRRDTSHGGRLRLAIQVTWDGVDQPRSTGRMTVDQPRSGGGSPTIQGVDHRRSTNQSPPQNEDSDRLVSLEGEGEDDPALRVAEGPEAAAYLRACMDASRKGLPLPPIPLPAKTSELSRKAQPARAATPLAAEAATPSSDRPTPTPPPAPAGRETPRRGRPAAAGEPEFVTGAEIRRMVDHMTGRFALDVRPLHPSDPRYQGRRKTSPLQLQQQLAELRRRHGRKGGTPAP